jgi:aminoglycoside phosphotransferase (APT) family kinase protein
VVKLPVGSIEHSWTLRLGAVDPERYDDEESESLPTPRVLAGGEVLAGYDLAWLVMERFEGQPMARDLDKKGILAMLEAAAAFYARARAVRPVQGQGRKEDWPGLLEKAREAVREQPVPNAQRWNEAIKKTQRSLDRLIAQWNARPIDTWCHGDLHPNNAMHRGGRCALIDLALVHEGSWVEDALYLERLFWGRKEDLCGVKPVSALAKACRKAGLDVSFDYAALANVRRVLTAACVPAFLGREGARGYLDEALAVVERLLPEITR